MQFICIREKRNIETNYIGCILFSLRKLYFLTDNRHANQGGLFPQKQSQILLYYFINMIISVICVQ